MTRITHTLHLLLRFARRKAKGFTLPGFDGAPLFQVLYLFIKGMVRGSVTTRASAVAFSFFVALFPAIIFVFTLIPYVPIANFQEQLLALVQGILPATAFVLVEATLIEVVTQKSGGLLSFGFLTALFFSQNGISALIDAFNATYHSIESRSFMAQHLVALLLTLILPVIVILAIAFMLFGQRVIEYLVALQLVTASFTYHLLVLSKWVIVVGLFLFCIAFLFYLAPAGRTRFRFISTGAIMATVLIIITSLGFTYLVNNVIEYNKLYGSIGSLLALMAWLYFNSIGLIVGFELNVSISLARRTPRDAPPQLESHGFEEYSTD